MKYFLCIAAILMGASAFPNVKPDISMVNPEVLQQMKQMHYIADNFDSWTPRKQIENINDFVDMVIIEVRNFIVKYQFDPMTMPLVNETVNLVGTDVRMTLSDGAVHNASSIFRNGDVSLEYLDRKVTVTVPIFFKLLHMNYNYSILVGKDSTLLEGVLDGEVLIVDVNFAVQLDFKKMEITLKSFEIPKMGSIDIKFTGGMLDWIVQALTEYITGEFKEDVVFVVEAVCKFTLTSIFDIINKVLGSIRP